MSRDGEHRGKFSAAVPQFRRYKITVEGKGSSLPQLKNSLSLFACLKILTDCSWVICTAISTFFYSNWSLYYEEIFLLASCWDEIVFNIYCKSKKIKPTKDRIEMRYIIIYLDTKIWKWHIKSLITLHQKLSKMVISQDGLFAALDISDNTKIENYLNALKILGLRLFLFIAYLLTSHRVTNNFWMSTHSLPLRPLNGILCL